LDPAAGGGGSASRANGNVLDVGHR
jgi:hypothetical protein